MLMAGATAGPRRNRAKIGKLGIRGRRMPLAAILRPVPHSDYVPRRGELMVGPERLFAFLVQFITVLVRVGSFVLTS